jgi:hypothetical protein
MNHPSKIREESTNHSPIVVQKYSKMRKEDRKTKEVILHKCELSFSLKEC